MQTCFKNANNNWRPVQAQTNIWGEISVMGLVKTGDFEIFKNFYKHVWPQKLVNFCQLAVNRICQLMHLNS